MKKCMTFSIPLLIITCCFFMAGCATSDSDGTARETDDSVAAACDRLAVSLFGRSAEYELAVLPFESDGSAEASELGLIIQDELISSVFREKLEKVVLYERSNLNRIIEEQKLSLTGLSENSVEIGRLVSVSQIICGRIDAREEGIRINAKIIDVETGAIRNSVSETIGAASVKKSQDSLDDTVREGSYKASRLRFVSGYRTSAELTVKKIILRDGIWTEYNSSGRQLTRGNYSIRADKTIGVTWTDSFIQTMIGNTTTYEYTLTDGVFSIRISAGNRLIGFVQLERMD